MVKDVNESKLFEAVQINWRNWKRVRCLVGDLISEENPVRKTSLYSDTCGEKEPYIEFTVFSPHGDFIVRHGDYVVKTVNEKYPYFVSEVK